MDVLFYNLIRKMVTTPERFTITQESCLNQSYSIKYTNGKTSSIKSWYIGHSRNTWLFTHQDFTHEQCVKLAAVCRHVRAIQLRGL